MKKVFFLLLINFTLNQFYSASSMHPQDRTLSPEDRERARQQREARRGRYVDPDGIVYSYSSWDVPEQLENEDEIDDLPDDYGNY